MPRQPAQHIKPRKYCRTEFHPDAEEYLKDLADDVGVQVAYVIRLCVARSLPAVEADLREAIAHGKELPHDELKQPSKPLKTTLRRSRPTPDVSRLAPPPIAEFLETGEMPPGPQAPGESCAPSPSPEPREHPQEPERPAEPAEPPAGPRASDLPDASPEPLSDPLQEKLKRVAKLRRG